MGNYQSTKAEIKTYLSARTPLILIDTQERERAELLLQELDQQMRADILYYTDTRQVCTIGGRPVKDVDSDPLPYITETFRKKRNAIFAFGDIKRIDSDNAYSREVLNILYLAQQMRCTLILITADPVWSRLAQFGMLTTLDYPDDGERIRQIREFLTPYRGRFSIGWDEDDIRTAATLMRGFSQIQIDNILATTLARHGQLDRCHLDELTEQKNRLYAAVPCVQPIRVSRELTVSGLDGLKQ